MKHIFTRGSVQIIVASIAGVSLLLGSAFTSWATANNRVAAVERNLGIVEERENNHYLELNKTLLRIEATLNSNLSK